MDQASLAAPSILPLMTIIASTCLLIAKHFHLASVVFQGSNIPMAVSDPYYSMTSPTISPGLERRATTDLFSDARAPLSSASLSVLVNYASFGFSMERSAPMGFPALHGISLHHTHLSEPFNLFFHFLAC